MDRDGPLELIEDIAVFRATGEVPLEGAAHLVTTALTTARIYGRKKLMVDVSALTGFSSPSLDQRRVIAREWAIASAGNVQLALVMRNEHIDEHRFGAAAAANFGLIVSSFNSEDAALAWLRAEAD
jgi:hypothetical protein